MKPRKSKENQGTLKPIVLVDANHLMHQSYHAKNIGRLTYRGVLTGPAFGFLKTIKRFQELGYSRFAFCFDCQNKTYREHLYPKYKSARKKSLEKASPEEQTGRKLLKKAIKTIRKETLPSMGFKNIWYEKGYEADDLIGVFCQEKKAKQPVLILSSDEDFFQLLSPSISQWSLRRDQLITDTSFEQQYGIQSGMWADVKAIAGCSSDSIEGIKGIGEASAIKFLQGKLTGARYDSVVQGNKIWEDNLQLVTLPFEKCPLPKFVKDKDSPEKWNAVCRSLGMTSIMKRIRKDGKKKK